MYLLPAIDILDGRAVRLARGDYSKVTVYQDDPALQAQLFEEDGAQWVHVVDLDGAKEGKPKNLDVIKRILQRTNLKVEVGGGVRSLDTCRRLADVGASRMVLGTALVKNPDMAQVAREEFGPEMLTCGIDADKHDVKVEGWVQGAGVNALELAQKMGALGFEHMVYTDIARDGMRTGISAAAYVEMSQAFGNPVVASGGIAMLADIVELARVSSAIEGVIVGRAIYEGAFSVADGIAACAGTLEFEPNFAEQLEKPLTIKDLES
ncbi:1-(5-phosphoribosyl)-5-[(5-phosphoribosylamino)methylideneamino]imidazole-4-carboxamide isomerase [Adlercreutzia sp. ZJ154]|uniref:1-(5-phosphoribosyl)-5-[(5- phosphoribosylamino)methylideneamino]imidazole-4- carboxamide isomerase n=1 Tax=Adlercreutzia sp. ZJ154 TaxID=2709790 RepID=UPI0013EA9512|nr:1-(5-phosphoribosyl)-5-[(5-phosphoribosylamino)methylideneamino]imidazole-4-carboxamide isomerase [Adlercreutzia sp. ZJ154]